MNKRKQITFLQFVFCLLSTFTVTLVPAKFGLYLSWSSSGHVNKVRTWSSFEEVLQLLESVTVFLWTEITSVTVERKLTAFIWCFPKLIYLKCITAQLVEGEVFRAPWSRFCLVRGWKISNQWDASWEFPCTRRQTRQERSSGNRPHIPTALFVCVCLFLLNNHDEGQTGNSRRYDMQRSSWWKKKDENTWPPYFLWSVFHRRPTESSCRWSERNSSDQLTSVTQTSLCF